MVVLLISSCNHIVSSSINQRVEELNEKCPIRMKGGGEITKVEYRNNVICFYITDDENILDLSLLDDQKKETIENDVRFRKECIAGCLGNETVRDILTKHLTETMIEEVNLKFGAIISSDNSNNEIEIEVAWGELKSK